MNWHHNFYRMNQYMALMKLTMLYQFTSYVLPTMISYFSVKKTRKTFWKSPFGESNCHHAKTFSNKPQDIMHKKYSKYSSRTCHKNLPINEHKNFNLRNWPHGTCKAMTIRVKCQEQKTVQFNIVLHLLNKVASVWHSSNNFQTGTGTWVNSEWRILTRSGAEEKTLRISHCFNLYLSFGTFVLNDLFYRPTRLRVLEYGRHRKPGGMRDRKNVSDRIWFILLLWLSW